MSHTFTSFLSVHNDTIHPHNTSFLSVPMSHTFTSFLSVHNDDTIHPCHTPLHLSYQFITTTQYTHVTYLYIFLISS